MAGLKAHLRNKALHLPVCLGIRQTLAKLAEINKKMKYFKSGPSDINLSIISPWSFVSWSWVWAICRAPKQTFLRRKWQWRDYVRVARGMGHRLLNVLGWGTTSSNTLHHKEDCLIRVPCASLAHPCENFSPLRHCKITTSYLQHPRRLLPYIIGKVVWPTFPSTMK